MNHTPDLPIHGETMSYPREPQLAPIADLALVRDDYHEPLARVIPFPVQSGLSKAEASYEDTVVHGTEEVISNATELAPDSLTFREKFGILRSHIGEDLKNRGPIQKLGLVATAAWLAYEWGPGNETVTPIIAGQVINNTDGINGIAISAGAAAVFTFAQQIVSGGTLAATATQFPEAAKKASELLQDNEHPELSAKPWKQLPFSKRLLYSFTMGTTFIATREAGVTGDVKFSNSMKRVIGSAALTTAAVGVLAAGVETVDYYTENAPNAVETVGDIFVSVATSPVTWLSILGFSVYSERKQRKAIREQLVER